MGGTMKWLSYFVIIVLIGLAIYGIMAIGVKRNGYKSSNQVKRDAYKELTKNYCIKVKPKDLNKRGWKKSKAKYFK